MSASHVRALVALTLLVLSTYVAITKEPRLGLDLRGGTQIVLEAEDTAAIKADRETTDRAVDVLRRRVDALGVAEPTLQRSGERRIIVELPGVQDPRQAAEVIGRTAQLTFHPVLEVEPDEGGPPGEGGLVLPDEGGQRLRLGAPALTGDGVRGAEANVDPQGLGGWHVTLQFKGSGSAAWERLTAEAACAPAGDPRRRIAIVLDDQVISSPQVEQSVGCRIGIIGGSTQITGSFTAQEAKDLAALVRGGALPVPVKVIEQRTVGPTLGAAAIDASARAALIGGALTGLFIIAIYRLVGLLATFALSCYALISYAALVALGATLTLPGLAGFVLAIGMAIDANVLVFERAREEYAADNGRRLRAAVTNGFRKAWSAIADSNATTLLAAGLLFYLATGPVRGFGVTLALGVVVSMLSALVVTRVLVEWLVGRRWVRARPGWTGLAAIGRVREAVTRHDPDLMRHARVWLSLSAVALVLAAAGLAVRGPALGVEFTGGRLVDYSTSRPLDVERARAAVADAGFPRAVVQRSGDDDLSVRTGTMTNDQEVAVRMALERAAGGEVTKLRDELIGPSLGDELRRKALIALGLALAAQLTYLAVRFRWTFGTAAVVAMAHDVVILLGIFAWLGKTYDAVFLAALLTVIGYSVNDSVVVFDRVRELRRQQRKTPFRRVVNTAVLQTVPRTVNTGLGALFILSALTLLGGSSLTDFALALLLGIVIGTYSSMLFAAPLLVTLEERAGTPATHPPRRTNPPRAAARPRYGGS